MFAATAAGHRTVRHRRLQNLPLRQLRNLLLIVMTALLVGQSIVAPAPAAYADVGDFTSATWNMRGSTSEGESKWTTEVHALAQEFDVVALQEVGQVPSRAEETLHFPSWGGTVREYLWRQGDREPPVWIYYLRVDGHTNLALVTRHRADFATALPPPGGPRGVLGIELESYGHRNLFFTAHADSPHGEDADDLVQAVINWVGQEAPGASWEILADWNREPGTWEPPGADSEIINPDRPTYINLDTGRELEIDYMVTNSFAILVAIVITNILSDHYAVCFRRR